MRSNVLVSIAGGLIVAAAAVLTPAPAVAQAEDAVARGARVYGDVCGRCHNPRSPIERSDQEWVIIINHMRVRGNLTGQQARSVLAFLQATNVLPTLSDIAPPVVFEAEGTPASRDPQVIANGERLVSAKACIGCHLVRGQGGQVGPGLDNVVERRGVDFVRQKLANPLYDNPMTMMPNFALTAREIEALVAYLASLQRQF